MLAQGPVCAVFTGRGIGVSGLPIRLADAHPEVLGLVQLQLGELPVVSFFRSETSWYLFTTRRILGSYYGQNVEVAVLDVAEGRFGNFKGHGGKETEVMTLRLSNGSDVSLEFEANKASMAPIWYISFWWHKYPILEKLKIEP